MNLLNDEFFCEELHETHIDVLYNDCFDWLRYWTFTNICELLLCSFYKKHKRFNKYNIET